MATRKTIRHASEPLGLEACLAPVADAGVRILILGSFPGEASLRAAQYYAHPRNQFWPILGAVLGEPLQDRPYAERLQRLLATGIGLWDVIGACRRPGSLDADIRDARHNDLLELCKRLPQLRRVCFNGKTAGRAASSVEAAGLEVRVCPSTSPAHAGLSFEQKRQIWRQALTL